LKHLFIRHVVTTQAYDNSTPEERRKFFDEINKVGKDYGIKLIFWGTPWGVPESLTLVFESDKSLDNYASFARAHFSRMEQLGLKPYWSSGTTITVVARE
jgi:hypothetical protein